MVPTIRAAVPCGSCVGVERDDVTDMLKHSQRTGFSWEAVVLFLEQAVQVQQLAALTLHPIHTP